MTLLSTWNVNGLRSIASKGFFDYLSKNDLDVICLQEIKAHESDIKEILIKLSTHYEVILSSAIKKGYSGTAILVKKSPSLNIVLLNNKINIDKFDDEGRFTILETEHYFLINGYFPNGQRDHGRVAYKLEFSFAVLDLALQLRKNKPVIIAGDFNTAHNEIDLKNPKSNIDSTGFLPIEREYLDQLIENNFIDYFRYKYPNQNDAYTWWTYRSNCREKNIGWRLDYFFVDQSILPKIKHIQIMTDVYGSDHCPVHLELLDFTK